MKLRIDYHFHPNLPKSDKRALKKCEKWWKHFQKNKINCVIITEHIYKNPKRAFEFMNKTKPKNCFCFPGTEYCTKEGIDIIIFSKKKSIYTIPNLKKTFKIAFSEVVKKIQSDKSLHSYIPHPHTLGLTSALKILGSKKYFKYVNLLKAVEISNGAFDNLFLLLNNFPLNKLTKNKIESITKVQKLPKKYYPKNIKFLAVGSDAHLFSEVGNCLEINSKKSNVFNTIVKNKGRGNIFIKRKRFKITDLIRAGTISLKEYLIKKRLK
jgi:hypothetical protein